MQYRFTCDYTSGAGSWNEGDLAEFDDATAAWLLRDVPGSIVPVEQDTEPDLGEIDTGDDPPQEPLEPQEEESEEPEESEESGDTPKASNRQVKAAPKQRG